jgi:hypothetical protein
MRARRVDANLGEIVKAARAIGMLVHVTNGDWDATVQYMGITELWECKTKKGKFTELQKKMNGQGWKIRTVRNLLDVVQARREMMERVEGDRGRIG